MMRRWPVATVTGLGALAAFGAAASPAAALTPTRTAWWNEAPLGLVVSPSPVQPDQLMVAQGTARPEAVAAVYYSVAGSPDAGGALMSVSATLRLPLDTSSSVGTPAIEACPIQPSAAGWQKGGAQSGTPPADDCASGKGVPGQVSSDGASVVFTLTPAQQQAGSPGVFDLELVPASQTPFQAVFNQPGADDFTMTPPPAPPAGTASTPGGGGAPASGGSSAPAGSGQGAGTTGGGGTSGGDTSGAVTASPDFNSGDLGSAPALAAPSVPSTPSATTGGTGTSASGSTGTSGGVSRVAAGALRPTASGGSGGGLFGGRRTQLLGVWILVDTGLALFLFGSAVERAPRLLGSVAARRGALRAEAGADEVAAEGEVRGVGRFARVRTEPARQLY